MNIIGLSAIVTGGAVGLAKRQRLLAEQGAEVTILDLNEDAGSAATRRLDGLADDLGISQFYLCMAPKIDYC
ncbi:hypothetical protein [Novosphingobium guangzhouense]|uniref:hypothetical protein n=1 Tax=Novosphingobium guangzhouense TaxID=1850347 RepID=UPI001FE8A7B8|nr:hypothetical protein [Novosphingobium guangzhouense]